MNTARLLCLSLLCVCPLSFSFAQNPAAPNTTSTTTTTSANSDMTDARVVELSKMGLDDEIIIAKIKNGSCRFQLSDVDLLELKKAGVSSKVGAAMLDANALTAPRVTVDGKDVTLHTLGEAKVGGRLGQFATLGVKSRKVKAYLEGQHSAVMSSSTPAIEIDLPKGEPIDNFILVQLDEKSDRRELEVDSLGGIVGAKHGVREEAIRQTHVTDLGGNKYKLVTEGLKRGDYIIYVVGSADFEKGIYGRGYDFTVE